MGELLMSRMCIGKSFVSVFHGATRHPQTMKLARPKPVPPWNWLCQATGGVPLPRSERGGRREATQGVLHLKRSWAAHARAPLVQGRQHQGAHEEVEHVAAVVSQKHLREPK